MFGKLLKNDLKAQWHSVFAIYLCAFIIAAVAECFASFSENKIIAILASVLVLLALGFACIVTLIAVAIMYNNTLFGRAGYLTLTLPVKTSSLVRSKTLSGLIWIFSTYALFIGSFVLLVYQAKKLAGDQMTESVENLLSLFGVPSFFTIFVGAIFLCIMFIAIILLLVQCIYLAISLSHVSPVSKLGTFGAIIMFFVIFGVIISVAGKISDMTSMGVVITESALKFTTDIASASAPFNGKCMNIKLTGTILYLLCGIGLHFPITYLVKNKVNVK